MLEHTYVLLNYFLKLYRILYNQIHIFIYSNNKQSINQNTLVTPNKISYNRFVFTYQSKPMSLISAIIKLARNEMNTKVKLFYIQTITSIVYLRYGYFLQSLFLKICSTIHRVMA